MTFLSHIWNSHLEIPNFLGRLLYQPYSKWKIPTQNKTLKPYSPRSKNCLFGLPLSTSDFLSCPPPSIFSSPSWILPLCPALSLQFFSKSFRVPQTARSTKSTLPKTNPRHPTSPHLSLTLGTLILPASVVLYTKH